MKYIRQFTSNNIKFVWTELKTGAKSQEGSPMLRSEYDVFLSMEQLSIKKDIEPGSIYSIEE